MTRTAITNRDPAFRQDPQRTYDELRGLDGPYRSAELGCTFIVDYHTVRAGLRHKSFSVDARRSRPDSYMRRVAGTGVNEGRGDSAYQPPLVLSDDPQHRRMRKLMSKAFTPQAIDNMSDQITRVCRNLVDAIGERTQVDFIADFAGPLPTRVILDMMGMHAASTLTFKRWSEDVLWGYDPDRDADRQQRLRDAFTGMAAAFRQAIAERRAHPGADLISALVQAEDEGEQLSDLQIISLCTQLMVAGNVTTTDLIGNGMYALLQHPRQLERLRQRPELIDNAVEEMLRYDCPITETARYPTAASELRGCPVQAGETLTLSISAANHDPDVFPDPHTFDLARDGLQQHLGFGSGPHVCLGAPLARLESRIGFSVFLDRFDSISLATTQPAERRALPFFRGLMRLPLAVSTAAGQL